jgi:hypothetical protein
MERKMNASENPELRNHYLDQLRGWIEGRTTLPPTTLTRHLDPNIVHASETELCPMKPFYSRTLAETPPLSDKSVLMFAVGRLFERSISKELPTRELDGITGTVDGEWEGDIVEIKSTRQDMDRFNPLTSQKHWIQRTQGYCKIYGTNKAHLCVLFLVGNFWTHGGEGIGLKAWTLAFTPDEIAANWGYVLDQRNRLLAAISSGEVPDEEWVKSRRMGYECKECLYSVMCPYFKG